MPTEFGYFENLPVGNETLIWLDPETPGRGIKSRFDIVSTDFAASSG